MSRPFIEITDPAGEAGFIRADAIEGLCKEGGSPYTRVFVASGGFWRVKETRSDIMAKLRDIQSLIDMEAKS